MGTWLVVTGTPGVACDGQTHGGINSVLDLSEGPKALEGKGVAGKAASSRSSERELSRGSEQHCLWVDVSFRGGLTNAHRMGLCGL